MTTLILSLLSINGSMALGAEPVCLSKERGQIRYVEMGKTVIQSEAYCFLPNTDYLASQGCREAPCGRKTASKPLSGFVSAAGSPAFGFCKDLGGKGMIAAFWDGGSWKDKDLCIFGPHRFVAIDWLIKERRR